MLATMKREGIIKEAVQIMSPYEKGEFLTTQEVLKGIGLFDYRTVEALVKIGTEEELQDLIHASAEAILKKANTIPTSDMHKLRWADTKEEMIAEITNPQFVDLFVKVEEMVEKQEAVSRAEKRIDWFKVDRKRRISACLDEKGGEKERTNIRLASKSEIDSIQTSSVLDADDKERLIQLLEESTKECLEFLDEKIAEEPVKIMYYRTGSRVSVKVNLNQLGYRYRQGKGNKIRANKGDDYEQFPLIVSATYLESFLSVNDVRDQDVYVHPDSVDCFYQFDDVISVNLTPAFISEWYNYDCPNLYRHTPNKDRSASVLGMTLPHFTTTLIESTWSDVYIDQDIQDEEIEKLMKDYPHTRISKELKSIIDAREVEVLGAIDKVEEYVREMDSKVQAVINKYQAEIVSKVTSKIGDPHKADFGLDLGFVNVYCQDEEYSSKRNILANYKSSEPKWMNIELPIGAMSTTVMRTVFDVTKEYVKMETGLDLYCTVQLD